MFDESIVYDTGMNQVGYVEVVVPGKDSRVYRGYSPDGKMTGYVSYADTYLGTPPDGKLIGSLNVNKDGIIYRLSPRPDGVSGYVPAPVGFLERKRDMDYVYRRIAPGKGQLIGFVSGVEDLFAAGGAALLLLL